MSQPLAEGTLLNERYRVKRVIDSGGMSIVYEVEDLRLSGRWALKELLAVSQDAGEQAVIQQQFRKEAEILSRLSHLNLPKVVDYFVEGEREFLVEEYVEGKNLLALMDETEEFTEEQVISWALQLCDCFTYIHDNGIIYRDLKCSNIILCNDGSIKLLDFGIARFYQAGKSQDTIIMDTPGFSPPEQYGTGQTDARSDVFSLGATIHFLLSRRDPSNTPFQFPPLRSLNVKVSPALEAVVAKAVQTTPGERYTSAAEFREALTRKEDPALKDMVFDYGAPNPQWQPYALASGILAAVDLLLVAVNPLWAVDILLLGVLPFASAMPAVLFRELQKRSEIRFIAKESELVYFEKAKRVRVPWEDVESLAFIVKKEAHGVPLVSEVEIRSKQGKFSYDTSPSAAGSITLALAGHQQLTDIIIKKAKLRQKTHGSNIYTRRNGEG
jgi:serine/threonine protein kinase